MHLWDRLFPQAEQMTLNMLKPANATPTVSAYMYAYGNHDFNVHPLAPLGCSVQLFETPEVRKLWGAHSVTGWYLGTAFEHYPNLKVYCKKTGAEHIWDTVWFKHKYLTNPSLTAVDHIIKAAATLLFHLLRQYPEGWKEKCHLHTHLCQL